MGNFSRTEEESGGTRFQIEHERIGGERSEKPLGAEVPWTTRTRDRRVNSPSWDKER